MRFAGRRVMGIYKASSVVRGVYNFLINLMPRLIMSSVYHGMLIGDRPVLTISERERGGAAFSRSRSACRGK